LRRRFGTEKGEEILQSLCDSFVHQIGMIYLYLDEHFPNPTTYIFIEGDGKVRRKEKEKEKEMEMEKGKERDNSTQKQENVYLHFSR
jgi:hypothetical protein